MTAKSVLKSGGKKKKKGFNNDVGHFLSGYGKVILTLNMLFKFIY